MEIILSANEKGGVAKTTTVLCLANCLTALGYKVLAVDMDPSGNLTRAALPEVPDKVLYDVFKSKCSIYDAIVHTDICDVLPTIKDEDDTSDTPAASYIWMAPKESRSLDSLQAEWMLKRALAIMKSGKDDSRVEQWTNSLLRTSKLEDIYDFIFIDSPPRRNLLLENGIVAADSVIVPCEPTCSSIDGLQMFFSSVNSVLRSYQSEIAIDGILFAKYSETSKTRREVSADIRRMVQEAGIHVYDTKFRNSAAIETSMNKCRPILDYVSVGTGASDAMNTTLEFLAKRGLAPKVSYPGVFADESGKNIFRKNGSEYYACQLIGDDAMVCKQRFRLEMLEDAAFTGQIGKTVFFDYQNLEQTMAQQGYTCFQSLRDHESGDDV